MSGLNKYLILGILFLSVSAVAYEGPFISDGTPWARLASNGTFAIYPMPTAASCFDDKVSVVNTEDPEMKGMVMSLVLAAQMSNRNVKMWVEKYDSTTPQRCKLAFIEIN
ncbi:hypothetical protein [Microbulbifer sp. JMSA008]|uniref:hypothetical protein n=1 Tax=Microbulbifer sp. JMSA008 TaxID=3243373 RepID=UPI0040390283